MWQNLLASKQASKQATGYFYLDLLKAFFAICVVAIHAKLGQEINNEYGLAFYNFIVSCAVPFFFVSSGYLLAEKITGLTQEEEQKCLYQYILKYIKMYVRWNIYFLPVTIWGFYRNWISGTGIVKIVLSWIRGFFFIGEQFCSWPLWYLLSMILGLLFVKVILRKIAKWSHWISVIGVGFFVLAWSVNFISGNSDVSGGLGLIRKLIVLSISTGRIFTGAAFVLLGIWIYYHLNVIAKYFPIGMVFVVIGIVISLLLKLEYSTTYPLALFVIPPIVKIACGNKKICNNIGGMLRQFSQDAYFTHMFFVFLLTYDIVLGGKVNTSPILVFAISLVGVVLVFVGRRFVLRLLRRRLIHSEN